MLKTYDYLKTAKPLKDWVVRDKTFSMDDFLIASKHLNIPISLQLLETASAMNFCKLVRVYSTEGFPSIDNTKIDLRNYNISYYKDKNQSFPNEKKYLPFP